MDLNELKLECPTSGILLGALVKSFELDDPLVGGASAEFLGSDGRHARRYFAGELFPEETRKDICLYVARAALHAGLLESFTIHRNPADPHALLPAADSFLADTLFDLLHTWDATLHRAAEGWPHPPRALGGFVVGRQAVIDLAIRAAALLHLCGISDSKSVVVAAPAKDAGGQLLKYIQSATGNDLSHHRLADRLARERNTNVERTTIDDWVAGRTIPSRDHLRALAKVLSGPGWPPPRLLRFLRVQFGFIALSRRLRPKIGDDFTGELLYTFAFLTGRILDFHAQSRAPRQDFLFSQRLALQGGILAPGSDSVLNAMLKVLAVATTTLTLHPELWIDDLLAARDARAERRIESCFSFIGDWPRDNAKFDADPQHKSFPNDERRARQVALSLICMSPYLTVAALDSGTSAGTPADKELAGVHAWQLVYLDRHSEAIPVFRQLLEGDPNNPETHCYLGVALFGTGDPDYIDHARRHFRESCRLNPGWDFPLCELARTHLVPGHFDQTLACIDAAPSDLIARSNDCNFVRALALAHLGRTSESLAAALRAAELDPKHAEAWSVAADQAFLIGDRQSARDYQKRAEHLGFTTVRRSGVAFPNAICPGYTADPRANGRHTPLQ